MRQDGISGDAYFSFAIFMIFKGECPTGRRGRLK